jgi:two-component system chemotaxis sensor kinase CheA
MFITTKRHEREKQDLIGASNRLTDAILKSSTQGLFLIDAKGKLLPQVSSSLATLFRRQDFTNTHLEKLIAPLVSAKSLGLVRAALARIFDGTQPGDSQPLANPLRDLEVRLPNPDGTFDTAHFGFDFRSWLVSISDITATVQQARELEDLRTYTQTTGEILRGVLQGGGARFGAFLQRTDAAMRTINEVLKKPAREADAFRNKLEETLSEVDRVRRDGAALKLTGLTAAARLLEDSLQELRSRGALSGSDFLPLAVKLDQLYGQFALLRSLTSQAGPVVEPDSTSSEARMTENGTQIIEAPKFLAEMAAQRAAAPKSHRMAQAGSLDSTLTSLTELVAHEHQKIVILETAGLEQVPSRYQATIKNVAIQMIRNAVMHGVETSDARKAVGKPPQGTLRVEFKAMSDQSFEFHFHDDGCGLDPDKVRAAAIDRGLLTEEAAARLRDRQAIKLIFKSGFTTLESAPGEAPHGTGMSLVRRYVHEAGGRIALASLLGHETRFKVTLPAVAVADTQVA